jgi:PPP family 3-phenylpropionic acid transporter
MWSVGIVFEIIMLYFQAPFLKNNLLLVIKISIFATVLRWLIVYLYPDNLEIIIISQTIHALSFGLYHSAVMIYLLQLYKNKRLAQQFLYGIAYGLGAFVGALVSGVVYGEYLFLYSSVFAFLAFIVLFYKNEHNYK